MKNLEERDPGDSTDLGTLAWVARWAAPDGPDQCPVRRSAGGAIRGVVGRHQEAGGPALWARRQTGG
eukprot:11590055-Alexandrium_andersonii.AAC.1